jgi:hypothetical protein
MLKRAQITVQLHIIIRSLYNVYEMKTCRTGRVCLSVCQHDSTRDPLDGFG